MDRDTRGCQNLLESREAPACVALVAAWTVEQERAPTVEGDGVNDHRPALLLTVLAVVALIVAVVAIVFVVVAVPAKIHAVQDHSENPALNGLDLLGGPSERLVSDDPRPNHQDDAVALRRERDAVSDRDDRRAVAQHEVEI